MTQTPKNLKKYEQILQLDKLRKTNIRIHPFGETIFVGIESDNIKEIDQQFNSWYNWMATNGDLQWTKDTSPYFACILSSMVKYKKYLYNVLENRFALNTGLELEGAAHKTILEMIAETEYEKIERENFVPRNTFSTENYNISPEFNMEPHVTLVKNKQKNLSTLIPEILGALRPAPYARNPDLVGVIAN